MRVLVAGMILGGLERLLLKTSGMVENFPAAIGAGSRRHSVPEISSALLVFGESGILELVMRAPVIGMRPRMSHSDYHGDTLAQFRQKERPRRPKT